MSGKVIKITGGKKPSLALVGPISPWRGGIAQYTTQLHEALEKQTEVRTLSFKKMYPKLLYPGKSNVEPGMEGFRMPAVNYKLNIYSPLSWRKAANTIINSGCEVAILTWWTLIWQPGLAYMARRLRRHGVKVIFLCHNLFDHDAKGLKRKLSENLLSQADAYIVHATEEKAMLASIRPTAPVLQRILPVYGRFPEPIKKLKKRGRLELLFFGFIRPYKGLDVLVEALAKLRDEEIYLTVVGEAWGDVDALRQRLQGLGAPNIELRFEYVDEQEAANYFARADVVVLPYRSATGSAVLSLAYHYRKPVLATRVGGLPDGVIEGKTGWLVPPNNPKALASALTNISRKQAIALTRGIEVFCKNNSWEAFAEALLHFASNLDKTAL
jgi:glycosyltransferase involved in cell wall biosynthesis